MLPSLSTEFFQGAACAVGAVWVAVAVARAVAPLSSSAAAARVREKAAACGAVRPPPPGPGTAPSGDAPCSVTILPNPGAGNTQPREITKARARLAGSVLALYEEGAAPAADADAAPAPRLLGEIRVDACDVRLVRTKKRKKAEVLKLARWDPHNYLRLTDAGGGAVHLGGEACGELRLRLPRARELERWFTVLQQACRTAEGTAPSSVGLGAPPGRVGAEWRARLAALRGANEFRGAPGAAERALNAVLARLVFHWQRRPAFLEYVQKKINQLLRKVALPKPLTGRIHLAAIGLGPRLPVLSRISAVEIVGGHDVALEVDVSYTEGTVWGVVHIDADVARFNMLPRIEATGRLHSFEGRMRLEITGGASDYMWLSFVGEPRLDFSLSLSAPGLLLPIEGVDTGAVVAALRSLIAAELIEALVYPRMEDIFLPLIDEDEVEDDTWVVDEESWRKHGPKPPDTQQPGVPPHLRTAGAGAAAEPPEGGSQAAAAASGPSGGAQQPQPDWADEGARRPDLDLNVVAKEAANALSRALADIQATAKGQALPGGASPAATPLSDEVFGRGGPPGFTPGETAGSGVSAGSAAAPGREVREIRKMKVSAGKLFGGGAAAKPQGGAGSGAEYCREGSDLAGAPPAAAPPTPPGESLPPRGPSP